MINLIKNVNRNVYITGPAARAYLNEKLFETYNIKLVYFEYGPYPPYNQIHGPFINKVSIIDLLFNTGLINAKKFLGH